MPNETIIPYRDLVICDDLLCRHAFLKTDGLRQEEVMQLFIPRELVKNVLKLVHDPPGSVHPGKDRTLKHARLKYFWLGMAKDIKEHVRRCHSCAVHQGHVLAPAPMLTTCQMSTGESFTRCPHWIYRDGKR